MLARHPALELHYRHHNLQAAGSNEDADTINTDTTAIMMMGWAKAILSHHDHSRSRQVCKCQGGLQSEVTTTPTAYVTKVPQHLWLPTHRPPSYLVAAPQLRSSRSPINNMQTSFPSTFTFWCHPYERKIHANLDTV